MTQEPIPPFTAVPTKQFIYPYLLLALHELGGSARRKDVINKVIERLDPNDDLSKEVTEKGDLKLPTRVEWSQLNLSLAGYTQTSNGNWSLSQQGSEKIPDLNRWLSDRDKESLDNFRKEVSRLTKEESRRRRTNREEAIEEENTVLMTQEPMPPFTDLPTKQFIHPYLLLVLHELGGSGRRKDVINKVIERLDPNGDLIKEVTDKGDPKLSDRVEWSKLSLSFAGYTQTSDGIWSLSQQGREKVPDLIGWLSNRDKESLDNFRKEVSRLTKQETRRRRTNRANAVEEMVAGEETGEKTILMTKGPIPPLRVVPTKQFIYPYLLLALHELGGSARRKAVIDKVIEWLDPNDELIKEVAKKGSLRLPSRVVWSQLDLLFAGYLKSSGDSWSLSQQGKEKIPDLTKWLSNQDEASLDNFIKETARLTAEEVKRRIANREETVEEMVGDEETDREEEQAEQEKQEQQEQESQLNKIRAMDPFAFERLCKKLFEAVGYEDAIETKQTGDHGIDGFGFFSFGLVGFKVVFQAKRYQEASNISSDRIHRLHGAMKEDGAEKAVFITTSDFTRNGRNTARKLGIECINGDKLIELLKKYELGYSRESVATEYTSNRKIVTTEYKFNEEFFDNV